MEIFLPLMKVDIAQRIVYGVFAAEEPDGANEIMDYASSKPEFEKWSKAQEAASDGKSLGNVREMHTKCAIGKVISFTCDDLNKRILGAVKVVDDAAWAKVEAGVYTGFSVGGAYKDGKRWKDEVNPLLKRYTAEPKEMSLVDSPCMKSATFEVIKLDGSTELRKFVVADVPDAEQVWLAKDGSVHKTKKAALEKSAAPAAAAPLETLKKMNEKLDEIENGDAPAKPRLKKADGLEKDMFNVSRLAGIVDDLKWLAESIAYEKAIEGGNSPTSLEAVLSNLGSELVAMATEEVKELSCADAEKFSGLPQADIDRLTKFNLPTGLAKVRVETNPELEKATGDLKAIAQERDDLKKVVSGLNEGLEKFNARLAFLEKQPRPVKGAVRAVDKGSEINSLEPVKDPAEMPKTPSGLSPRDARALRNIQ